MRRRVVELVGPDAESMWVLDLPLGLPADAARQRRRARLPARASPSTTRATPSRRSSGSMKDLGLDTKRLTPRSVAAAISRGQVRDARRGGLRPARRRRRPVLASGSPSSSRSTSAALRSANAMDFDDLLVNTVGHAARRRGVLEHYRRRFRHLLVDEFQDTNGVQNEIVSLLAPRAPQPLRGGRRRPVDLPLPRGRRAQHPATSSSGSPTRPSCCSSRTSAVDPDDPRRGQRGHREQPRPTRARTSSPTASQGEPIRLYRAGDEHDEGRWVGQRAAPPAQPAPRSRGTSWPSSTGPTPRAGCSKRSSCARACPTASCRGCASTTARRSRTALAYARLIVNPRDEASARRVVNEPKRGIGATAQARLGAYAAEHGLGFAEADPLRATTPG